MQPSLERESEGLHSRWTRGEGCRQRKERKGLSCHMPCLLITFILFSYWFLYGTIEPIKPSKVDHFYILMRLRTFNVLVVLNGRIYMIWLISGTRRIRGSANQQSRPQLCKKVSYSMSLLLQNWIVRLPYDPVCPSSVGWLLG